MILSFSKEYIYLKWFMQKKSITGALIGIKAITRKRRGTSHFCWDEDCQERLIGKAKLEWVFKISICLPESMLEGIKENQRKL